MIGAGPCRTCLEVEEDLDSEVQCSEQELVEYVLHLEEYLDLEV